MKHTLFALTFVGAFVGCQAASNQEKTLGQLHAELTAKLVTLKTAEVPDEEKSPEYKLHSVNLLKSLQR